MKKRWVFEIEDGKLHEVTLEEDWITQRYVRLDGRVVVDDLPLSNLGKEYKFDCDGHPCRLKIGRNYLVLRRSYTLTVDGRDIAEGV